MASPTSKPPSKPVQALKKTSVTGSFPVISGGQTNFLVSFLTGFNYTRMIFRVKDISKKVQTVPFFLTCAVWNMHSNFGILNTVKMIF